MSDVGLAKLLPPSMLQYMSPQPTSSTEEPCITLMTTAQTPEIFETIDLVYRNC